MPDVSDLSDCIKAKLIAISVCQDEIQKTRMSFVCAQLIKIYQHYDYLDNDALRSQIDSDLSSMIEDYPICCENIMKSIIDSFFAIYCNDSDSFLSRVKIFIGSVLKTENQNKENIIEQSNNIAEKNEEVITQSC